MNFLLGFNKTASIADDGAKALGKIVGSPVGFLKGRSQATRQFISHKAKQFGKGVSEAASVPRINPISGAAKPAIGSTLEKATLNKAQRTGKDLLEGEKEQIRNNARGRVIARAKKQNAGPSFASRHPYVTAGGAALAAKTVFEPKKDDNDSRPAVMYPQP